MRATRLQLSEMKTIHAGTCCDLKIQTATTRVWLCRFNPSVEPACGNDGITTEKLVNGRWVDDSECCAT